MEAEEEKTHCVPTSTHELDMWRLLSFLFTVKFPETWAVLGSVQAPNVLNE
jgi:hypothetical protein